MSDLGQYAADAYAELAREKAIAHEVVTVADVIDVVITAVVPVVHYDLRQALLMDKELCLKMSPGALTEVLRKLGES